jgi:hypothetical protein
MRKTWIIVLTVLANVGVFAQPADKMSYQAIIRDINGSLVQNHTVGILITILQNSADVTEIFIETHSPSTNANGLVNLEIGNGIAVSGTFNGIDWSKGPFFIRVDADISGGTNYSISGVSQILSVPYALYAKTAETIAPLKIGDTYGGGIVFYVYDKGRHGLIAAPVDQSTGIRWHAGGDPGIYTGTAARADGAGAGRSNTAIVVASQGYGDGGSAYAARICNEYSGLMGGVTYGDWYLPSKFELNLLYLEKNLIGGLDEGIYWSSTEVSNPMVWSQDFANGLQTSSIKNNIYRVRAIRAF